MFHPPRQISYHVSDTPTSEHLRYGTLRMMRFHALLPFPSMCDVVILVLTFWHGSCFPLRKARINILRVVPCQGLNNSIEEGVRPCSASRRDLWEGGEGTRGNPQHRRGRSLTPTATLQGDLGAESIDFLDIVFRLERGVRDQGAVATSCFRKPYSRATPISCQHGRVTDRREWGSCVPGCPTRTSRHLSHDRRLSAVSNLFTVNLLARYVAWKLNQRIRAPAQ